MVGFVVGFLLLNLLTLLLSIMCLSLFLMQRYGWFPGHEKIQTKKHLTNRNYFCFPQKRPEMNSYYNSFKLYILIFSTIDYNLQVNRPFSGAIEKTAFIFRRKEKRLSNFVKNRFFYYNGKIYYLIVSYKFQMEGNVKRVKANATGVKCT
ncbi:hypothetical protein M2135_000083 [Parabacteroides sp. PF5-9]|nr:hypothetical protein [Parabacteroides sp. PF5-9]